MAEAVAVRSRPPAAARATLRYVRGSASKARVVLDQIRDKSYVRAAETLKFSERRIAGKVLQCLESAGANAENNKQFDTDELFILECYADVGPSIKRWRPRARGRAAPITKRTCHITVVLGRFTAEEREILTSRSTAAQEARRRRVAASRAEAASKEEVEEAADAADRKGADDVSEAENVRGDASATEADARDAAAAANDPDDKTDKATADETDKATAAKTDDAPADAGAPDAGAPAQKKTEEH